MANKFKVHLHWQDCSDVIRPAPLVVLLPWVWAESKYTAKYAELAARNGWDVLTARWPMQAMWFPLWAHRLAMSLVEAIGSSLLSQGERPVVFWAFSGSAKGVFSSVLSILSGQHSLSPQQNTACTAVLRCCCGVIYDSCPVDFTSDIGKKLLAPATHTSNSSRNSQPTHPNSSSTASPGVSPSNSINGGDSKAARAADAARSAADAVAGWSVGVGAGMLDFFLLEWFDRDREAMWCTLENPPVHGPFLFLYSRSDELADASQISQLASTLRQRGHSVVEQVWHDTPHCGHYRYHAQQYEESVSYFFSQALRYWSDRRGRLLEGREIAARWEQQLPTQQQGHQQQQRQQLARRQQPEQQLVRQPARGIIYGALSSNNKQPWQQQEHSSATRAAESSSRPYNDSCQDKGPPYDARQHSSSNQTVLNSRNCDGRGSSGCTGATSSCCCSADVLAAATAAAVAGTAAGLVPGSHAQKHKRRAHASTAGKHVQHSRESKDRASRSAGTTGGGRSWPALAAATAAISTGVAGDAFISTCCGCQASECRCAETLAAASGEVVCSDTATLAHSLRCMASSYIGWQQQQQCRQESWSTAKQLLNQQPQQQHQQDEECHKPTVSNRGLGLQRHKTSSSSSSSGRRQCAEDACLSNVWSQQRQHQQGRQQHHSAPASATKVRSRL